MKFFFVCLAIIIVAKSKAIERVNNLREINQNKEKSNNNDANHNWFQSFNALITNTLFKTQSWLTELYHGEGKTTLKGNDNDKEKNSKKRITKTPVSAPTMKPRVTKTPVSVPTPAPRVTKTPLSSNRPSSSKPVPVIIPVGSPSLTSVTNIPITTVSSSPISRIVSDPLCCAATSYASTNWGNCAAGASTSQTADCSQCIAFQCIDWTAGSVGMKGREASYATRTGDSVYFGVGSYGNDQTRAGKCYRITASNLDRDIIVQSINQGPDVPDANFDIQVGDGGFGLNNACTVGTTNTPQFDGVASDWGLAYGGWTDISGCDRLPAYPHCGNNPQDNLQDLCKWSFKNKFRNSGSVGSSNPAISKMCEVKCPTELYTATGLHRSDETNAGYTCLSSGISTGGVLTRMMDCSKPSYAWAGNVKGTTFSGFEKVIPCKRDGYTRVNK